jgi:hypothetical protein
MIDEAFCARALRHVEAGYFTNEALGWMWTTLAGYWQAYSMRLTDMPLREAVRQLSPEKAVRYSHEVELVIGLGNVPEAEYVKRELKDFIQRNIFAIAHQDSARLFNEGKVVESYDLTARAQERIQDVNFDDVDRIWLFEELHERQRERMRAQMDLNHGVVTTGIPLLDAITDGGVHPGELWVVFAYAKRCKTTWLINQGFNATRVHHLPTVHFVLEGKGRQIAARYDACFSQELYTNVKRGDIDAALYRQLAQEYEQLRRLCVVRTLNDWDVTILDIDAELHFLRTQGFLPKFGILDYMDLGRMRDAASGASETQHQVGFARDHKRLANKTDIGWWSAWQAQRPKVGAHEKEHVLTSSNVADAYAKVRIVDAYGSLNATDEEMTRGEMRVFMESHRDAPLNKLFGVTNDLSRMRMVTSAIEWTPPAAVSNEFEDN